MLGLVLVALVVVANIQASTAECANACNGHGKCTSYDMCICNRNWQAADCSERICQFGLAHVDTPKGDLDGSGGLSNADKLVIDNSFVYPYGTTEQFPQMQDSDLQQLEDTAHFYMECSNKGRCDRQTGECACYEGYDGVACQRASCPGYPNSCSGHGVCKTIQQLANSDNGNIYELWDKRSTMGCECDSGYFGPDCSQRKCKYGVDPLYLDDAATVKFSIYDVGIFTTARTNNFTYDAFQTEKGPGYWALRFYDNHDEDWTTVPIVSTATCDDVIAALEALPNNVIPPSSIECTRAAMYSLANTTTMGTVSKFDNVIYDNQHPYASQHPYRITYDLALWEAQTDPLYAELGPTTALTSYWNSNGTKWNNLLDHKSDAVALSGMIYRLKFYGNPGGFKQPEVEVYLDGENPTLLSDNTHKVITKVWTDGQQGEYDDYFADHCDGVTVTIGRLTGANYDDVNGISYLTGFTTTEKNLLKKCLGSADFNTSNNVDVYNWDHGSKLYPHLIKLVRTVTTYTDGGYYAVIYYDPSSSFEDSVGDGGVFRLVNPFSPPDNFETDNYDIYTTTGTLALTSDLSSVVFGYASKYVYTVNVSYDLNISTNSLHHLYPYDGDISCEVGNNNAHKFNYINHCLNTSDLFTLLTWDHQAANPPHINLYRAKRLKTMPFAHMVQERFGAATDENGYDARMSNSSMHFMTHVITTDISTNWGTSYGTRNFNGPAAGTIKFQVYKFFPAASSTYNYVAECANRGICDRDSGLCKCFNGYTSDSCAEQSSLAL